MSNLRWKLVTIAAVFVAFAAVGVYPLIAAWRGIHSPALLMDKQLKLGLDLKGGVHLVLRVKTEAIVGGHVGDVIVLKNYPEKAKAYAAFLDFRERATVKALWDRRGWKKPIYLFFKSFGAEESVHFLSAFEAMAPDSASENQRFYELYVADNAQWQLTGGACVIG